MTWLRGTAAVRARGVPLAAVLCGVRLYPGTVQQRYSRVIQTFNQSSLPSRHLIIYSHTQRRICRICDDYPKNIKAAGLRPVELRIISLGTLGTIVFLRKGWTDAPQRAASAAQPRRTPAQEPARPLPIAAAIDQLFHFSLSIFFLQFFQESHEATSQILA